MENCSLDGHDYRYGGVKYDLAHKISGSDAYRVYYYDWFYCRRCLIGNYNRLEYEGSASLYNVDQIKFGATPMEKE